MGRKRRGRGEGGITLRQDGLWTASVSFGYSRTGKRRRRFVYGKTKQEVQEKLRRLQECNPDAPQELERLTLESYLQRWLHLKAPTVEPGTMKPYTHHCNHHIVPHIGTVKLTKLESFHIEEMYAALAAKGVSRALQRKIGTTLTIALNAAVKKKMLRANPALAADKPIPARKPEIRPLDPGQVTAFLDAAGGDRLFALYVLALDSGMRPGEMFALEWSDVDFDRRQVVISKSLEELAGKLRVKDTKTPKGRRRIDVSATTIAALHEHRKSMLVEGNAAGPVFCDVAGGHLRLPNVRDRSFKPILKRACLPDVRFYDLRHTCASLLLLADESAKVVSERLGHASIALTIDTYSHLLPGMQKRAADKMELLLNKGENKAEKC